MYSFQSMLLQTLLQADNILIMFWNVGFFNEAGSFQNFSDSIFSDTYNCVSLIFVFYFISYFPKFPFKDM